MVEYLARLWAACRRLIGMPRGSRKLGSFRQAVFVLRWFREAGCVHCLARNGGISQATGYRYLHEGIDVLATQYPDPNEKMSVGLYFGGSLERTWLPIVELAVYGSFAWKSNAPAVTE